MKAYLKVCLSVVASFIIFTGILFYEPVSAAAAVTLDSPSSYSLTSLHVGDRYYHDRSYEIGAQPAGFENFTAVKTRNNDKNVNSSSWVELTVTNPVTVYVAYDRRASSLPDWLRPGAGFTATGGRVDSDGDGSMGYFNVYRKNYPAGQVVLGGNKCCGASGAGSNYIVYIEEHAGPLAVDPVSLELFREQPGTATITGGSPPYNATSDDPAVAGVSVSGNTVDISAVTGGTAVVTVTDGNGDSVNIGVTVIDPCGGVSLNAPSDYSLEQFIVGSEYYHDRSYVITSQPAGFENFCAVKTRNNDKNVNNPNWLELTVATPVRVYVAYDSRATQLPTWLRTASNFFASSEGTIGTTDVVLELYEKEYPAGQVELGGNACCSSAGAGSNYIVYLEGLGPVPLAVDPAVMVLAPAETPTATVSGGLAPYGVSSSDPAVATATIVGDTVTVEGVADGTADIVITDDSGDSVLIAVTVATPPLIVTPAALELAPGEDAGVTVSGGVGPYSANSADPAVATAVIAGDTVTVSGVADGTTPVTVTDSLGTTAIIDIEVMTPLSVTPAVMTLAPYEEATATVSGGGAPYTVSSEDPVVAAATVAGGTVTVTGGIQDGTIGMTVTDNTGRTGTITVTLTIEAFAVDPDAFILEPAGVGNAAVSGGVAPYGVSTADPAVATASFEPSGGGNLAVVGVADGSTTITVSDFRGVLLPVSVLTVSPLTVSPVSIGMSEGEIATATISGGLAPYGAVSGNSGIATVSVAGDIVTITSVGGGNVGTITVTVTDSMGSMASVLVTVGGGVVSSLESCPLPPFVTGGANIPNILLVLDHSGSMGSGAGSKWEVAKQVLKDIIDQFPHVRFGLMRMDGSNYSGNDRIGIENVVRQGGKVLKPVGTPHADIKSYIDNWGTSPNKPQTWTNLAETLASAGRYYATVLDGGLRVGKGPAGLGYYERNYHYNTDTGHKLECPPGNCDATTTDDKGVTIDTTSPIQYECQKSFIIFITDGLENYSNDWSVVTNVVGDYDGDGAGADCKNGTPGCSGQGRYVDDVAMYLFEHDMRSDLPGIQNLTTYMVGFQVDDAVLSDAATQGGGIYYTATDYNGLFSSLQDAIQNILDKISSGTAVATIATSAESEDHLIRAKFLPISWRGFLEAFPLPYDADGDPDWQAGSLLSTRLPFTRHIYTHLEAQAVKKQEFSTANTTLTTHLSSLWGVSGSETDDLIDFIRGDNANDGGKYRDREGWPLGDIIYSTPIEVGPPKFYHGENNYADFRIQYADRLRMVYVGANDGMLHAFRSVDDSAADCAGIDAGSDFCGGVEMWAYIPQGIQAELPSLTMEDCHKYFVDLSPVAADIWNGTEWKTVLIGGNRLGGEGYFCLDITEPAHTAFTPLWDSTVFPGFKSSTLPRIGKIRGGAVDKWVAVFTSGFHEGLEAGRIAALDISTGSKEVIWLDGVNEVDELSTQPKGAGSPYYTLSSPVAVDSDEDGYFDLIYAGDTEGTLWKFYYDYVEDFWKAVQFFQTGGQPITARPTVIFDVTGKLRILFGTGKYLVTGDKVNNFRNAFYAVIDEPVSTGDANDGHYTSDVTVDKVMDLVELTEVTNDVQLAALTATERSRIENYGWYFQLDAPTGNPASPAERVLEPAIGIAGTVFFTSFTPNSDVCGFGGDSKLYAVDYTNSLPSLTGDQQVLQGAAVEDRAIDLGPGLPSKPVFYYDMENREPTLIIQTSDTEIHDPKPDLPENPMTIKTWKTD